MNFKHISVLKEEAIKWLDPQPNQNFVDCTLGGGGHTLEILDKVQPKGKVLGIDLDAEAIESVKSTVKGQQLKGNLILVQDNFRNLANIYKEYFEDLPIHGVLLDLGVSSPQFDQPERGFSFKEDGPLDMRLGSSGKITAEDIVNKWSPEELGKIFREYGEEKFTRQIVVNIVKERESLTIDSTKQLAEIVNSSIPSKVRQKSKIHPATKVFQALRIAVNEELENLHQVLPQIMELLQPRGKVAIISFHSLEDRIVKQFFVEEAKDCICPPTLPVCRCSKQSLLKILTKKPISPDKKEIENNPRSRSAKLRVAEKL